MCSTIENIDSIAYSEISNIQMISEHLSKVLANEYTLYLQTLNFHWNIKGKNFISMHKLLEEHYEWLKDSVDAVAERIRTLGFLAPAHYKNYQQDALVTEGDEQQDSQGMIIQLCQAYANVIMLIRSVISDITGKKDYATEDLLTKLLGEHEKNLWMLKSHIVSST